MSLEALECGAPTNRLFHHVHNVHTFLKKFNERFDAKFSVTAKIKATPSGHYSSMTA